MPVLRRCKGCSALLNVEHLPEGKKAGCPKCKLVFVYVHGQKDPHESGADQVTENQIVQQPQQVILPIAQPKNMTELVDAKQQIDGQMSNQSPEVILPTASPRPEVILPSRPKVVPVASSNPAAEGTDKADNHPHMARQRASKKLINYPISFVWWQQRFHGRTFPFTCPDCSTVIQLKQRVTQSRRSCPGCGFRITTESIDRQLAEWEPERQEILDRPISGPGCSVILIFLGTSGFAGLVFIWCLA
jgi:DNA-directed RNA polymerase subunit RPC12/RpoP